MRWIATLLLLLLGACTTEPTRPDEVGRWKRSHPETHGGDGLVLAEDGSFEWVSYIGGERGGGGGSYTVQGDHLTLGGDSPRGAFALTATYAVDDGHLALGAYVPVPADEGYDALWRWTDDDSYISSLYIEPWMSMHSGSFIVSWIDPIWQRQKVDSGSYAEAGETILFQDDLEFTRVGDALVHDQGWTVGLAYRACCWYDVGLLFERD